MSRPIEAIALRLIDGGEAHLADWTGQVRLIVNVASRCGLTPQYAELEAIHRELSPRGFSVLGFPANDFGAQEPGTNDEIASFCSASYGVTFPMFGKLSVKGADRHPLYAALIAEQPRAASKSDEFRQRLASHGVVPAAESEVLWNFEKFLIGRDGSVIGRFAPDVTAEDPMLRDAIEAAL